MGTGSNRDEDRRTSVASFRVQAIGFVHGSRREPEDDYWGGEEAWITLTDACPEEALRGLEEFSHAEVLYLFHEVAPASVVMGARHPRGRKDWPEVGIFAQRARRRPNRIGSTMCRVVRIEGRTLFVAGLDAIEGTPVLDIKPVMSEYLPRDPIRQPSWSHEMMRDYWLVRR